VVVPDGSSDLDDLVRAATLGEDQDLEYPRAASPIPVAPAAPRTQRLRVSRIEPRILVDDRVETIDLFIRGQSFIEPQRLSVNPYGMLLRTESLRVRTDTGVVSVALASIPGFPWWFYLETSTSTQVMLLWLRPSSAVPAPSRVAPLLDPESNGLVLQFSRRMREASAIDQVRVWDARDVS
jgi:hypothetical protein